MPTATRDRTSPRGPRVAYRVHVVLEGSERRYRARDAADALELGARIKLHFPDASPAVVTVMTRKEEIE